MLVLASFAWSQQTAPPAELEARIVRLIQQLDHDSFDVREKAEAELAMIGEPALPKLTTAAKDASAERSQRAAKLLKQIRLDNVGLRFVSSVKRADLNYANSATVSPDGRFVYVSAWATSTANVFRRDTTTGALEHVQAITDRPNLYGLSALRVSPDGRFVVGACGSAQSVPLFTRDAQKGTLTVADIARGDPVKGIMLQQQSDAAFSPDSKFIYSLDRSGAVVVFEVSEERKLKHLQTFAGEDQCLANAVGIAMLPEGTEIFVVAANASALTVAKRDATTGKLVLHQVLRDEQEGIHGFAGVYGVCCSPDGHFVYTCSGSTGGDNAVTAFRVNDDGKLSLLQEFINEQSDLKDFVRGGEIVVTPDGLSVYAGGVASNSLACFERDPKTGKLSYRATIRNEGTSATMGDGPTGLGVSPDSKFLYAAISQGASVSVFQRISNP
jgi:6-phosphogluconolactonase (cycloisomerase 2 family)